MARKNDSKTTTSSSSKKLVLSRESLKSLGVRSAVRTGMPNDTNGCTFCCSVPPSDHCGGHPTQGH